MESEPPKLSWWLWPPHEHNLCFWSIHHRVTCLSRPLWCIGAWFSSSSPSTKVTHPPLFSKPFPAFPAHLGPLWQLKFSSSVHVAHDLWLQVLRKSRLQCCWIITVKMDSVPHSMWWWLHNAQNILFPLARSSWKCPLWCPRLMHSVVSSLHRCPDHVQGL